MSLRKLKKSELQEGLSAAIISAADLLEQLHVVHCKEDVKTFLSIKVGNTTLAHLINNLYKIILPGIKFAIQKIKNISPVLNWAAGVVEKLFAV